MNPFALRPARAGIVPAVLCLAALATLGFPGCDDVTGPGGGGDSGMLTMSNCWPNDDGRFWEYASAAQLLEEEPFTYLPGNTTVPEITLADARMLLAQPVTGAPGTRDEYPFQLQFAGLLTTDSGVMGQNLTEFIPIRSPGMRAAPLAPGADPFLARLAAARPDLRARIAAVSPASADAGAGVVQWYPILIHGYVWIKGPAWIGTYGDVDTMLAWKFLESNVRPGHTFRHQLVPSLASDVWLSASVERQVAVTVPGGARVPNAIEVLYLINYGVSSATDEMGNVIGTFRTFDYGKVVYAPGVGPVKNLERRMAFRGRNTTHGLYLLEMDLASTGIAPVMVASARGGS